MLPFQNILYPIDYSEQCLTIVPHVKEMVRRFSAKLTLVHAYGPEAFHFGDWATANPALPEQIQVQAEQNIKKFAADTFPSEHVETFAEFGEAGTVVDRVVRHQGTDLVMLATHGRGPIRRLLLGSVTTKILHDVTAAVWTGTGEALTGHTPHLPYQTVLCALNSSDEAEAVIKAAAAIADTFQARLSLVQAVEMPTVNVDVDFTPYKKDLMDAAAFRLRELQGVLGIDASHVILEGPAAEAIRKEAIRIHADLIVTGRGHALDTFGRIWSHLYPIIRESPCPVLSI